MGCFIGGIWISFYLGLSMAYCSDSKVFYQICEKLIFISITLLVFKLMFSSGVVKVFGGGTWLDLTALKYHFFTQPIPGPLSSWFHHLPDSMLTFACASTFYLELLVPLALLFPSKSFRHMAAIQLIGLQIVFMLSGNFAFFNLLSVVIMIPLISLSSSTKLLFLSKFILFKNLSKTIFNNYSCPYISVTVKNHGTCKLAVFYQ